MALALSGQQPTWQQQFNTLNPSTTYGNYATGLTNNFVPQTSNLNTGFNFGDTSNLSGTTYGNVGTGLTNNFEVPSTTSNGFGMNIPTLQLGLQGLNTLAGLYTGMKSLGLAQDQFDFSKQMAQTNLANQTTAYNTGLEDRLRTRAQFNGKSPDSWQADFERLKAVK